MTRLLIVCVLIAELFLAHDLGAQDAAQASKVTKVPVTRADLGWAYLRLERAYFANQPTDDSRIAQLNQDFDTATKKFFSGNFSATIAEVNQLTHSLIAQQPSISMQVALSLKPTVTPAVLRLDEAVPLQIRLTSIYPVDGVSKSSLSLSLIPVAGGKDVVAVPVSLMADDAGYLDTTVKIDPTEELSSGGYLIALSDEDGASVHVGQLNVVASSLNTIRQANDQRLDAIQADHPKMLAAIAACRDRNGLLQDEPSAESSSQFLTDLGQLAKEVNLEIDALAGGNDPYRRRAGDYWRTFKAKENDTPVASRIYAPQQAIGQQAVPLVIALHGAGGDENMFFAGYGAGMIKDLADKHGFVVASPGTSALGGRVERLDHLISEIAADYAIDPQAIYLIGHSMGAFATATLTAKRADKIAAACCLAGGGKPPSDKIPPMLVIAGKLDSVIPITMLQPMATQAIDAGMPVELRVEEHLGHTLLVGAVLPEAIDWLLKHRLGEPVPTN